MPAWVKEAVLTIEIYAPKKGCLLGEACKLIGVTPQQYLLGELGEEAVEEVRLTLFTVAGADTQEKKSEICEDLELLRQRLEFAIAIEDSAEPITILFDWSPDQTAFMACVRGKSSAVFLG